MILLTVGILIAVIGIAAGVICGFLELLSIPILIIYFLYVVLAEIASTIKQKRKEKTKSESLKGEALRNTFAINLENGFINNDLKIVKSQDKENDRKI